jgi:(p)ppGpp synthase/HD superfamily hydrolase
MSGAPKLGPRFSDALAWAHEIHAAQTRKGGSIPYISHLLAVTGLVLEAGGDEDEAIAALLHDAVEDRGIPLGEIRRRCGPRVAQIVDGCSDVHSAPAGSAGSSTSAVQERSPATSLWRKEAYLFHLSGEQDPSVLRVSVADKLHNARAILADHRAEGDAVWERFNVGRLEQLWYYRELVRTFRRRLPGDPQAAELGRVVAALRRRAGSPTDRELDAFSRGEEGPGAAGPGPVQGAPR